MALIAALAIADANGFFDKSPAPVGAQFLPTTP
jgi:hypothetical protein